MKKYIAFMLTMLMLVSVFSVFALSSEAGGSIWVYEVDKTTNASSQRQRIAITKGKTYTVSYSGMSAMSSYADDQLRLTDSNAGTGTSYQSGFTGNGTTTVTVALGHNAIGMTDFYANFLNDSTYSFVLPSKVEFYVSVNGTDFDFAGSATAPANPSEDTNYSIGVTKERGCAATHVRFVIHGNGNIACAEVAAYIWADVTTISATGAEDSQGLVYSANPSAGTAYVTSYTNSYTTTETIQGTGITPCSAKGKTNNTTYVIGKGSETQVTVTASFISSSRSNRPGISGITKKYIVIHNTGNSGSTANAKANHNYQTSNSACTSSSWHYTVGADGIYQALPDDENAWHASDGSYGTSNYYGIGMEVCMNGFTSFSGSAWTNFLNNTFYTCCKRAAMLTAELCIRHGLNPGDCSAGTAIRQHWDTVQSGGYQKNCPQQMRYNTSSGTYTRDTGDMWVYYKNKVQEYYKMLKGGGTTTVTKEVANTTTKVEVPQYVYVSGSKTYCRVTGISGSAFASKSNLVSVYIPNTITWGALNTAFNSSSNLVDINVSPANTYCYSNGGKLYSSADNSVLATPAKNSGAGAIKVDPAVYSIANFTVGDSYVGKIEADVNVKRLTGLKSGVSVTEIKAMFVDNIKAYDANNAPLADGATIGTGTVLKSEDGADTCVVVIKGDIDGNGLINSTDFLQIAAHLKQSNILTDVYFDAARVGGNETVSSADYLMMSAHISKVSSFTDND